MDEADFESVTLSPKQRLAISRYAINRHMSRGQLGLDADEEVGEEDAEAEFAAAQRSSWGKLKFMARNWWRNHPANYAVQLASPSLHEYAARQPYKLVGIAAAVGAASMVIRPWRLVSITALALAPFKSSRFTSAAVAMLAAPPADAPPQ